MDVVINDAIQRALFNSMVMLRNTNTGTGSRNNQTQNNQNNRTNYFNTPPQGGYIVNDEYDYVLSERDEVSALVFLDIVSRFGSPGSESIFTSKEYRRNKIKQLGKYRKVKENDPIMENQCSICIEDFCCGEYQRTLNCNHSFHKKCIDKWFKKDKNDCPMCRANIISTD